uniref:Uncharacterized protein n=1 Tax=Arundo donax TaxID=35708 RepID=A0A0A9H401_ARUDO
MQTSTKCRLILFGIQSTNYMNRTAQKSCLISAVATDLFGSTLDLQFGRRI